MPEGEERGLKRKIEGFLSIVAFPSEGALFFLPEMEKIFIEGEEHIEWDSWEAFVSHYLDAGEEVVALGEYRGVNKTTGKSMNVAFAHVYWICYSRIVRFQQYADTLMVSRSMDHHPYVAEST